MTDDSDVHGWLVATGTARGAHHVHADLPNEDHVRSHLDGDPPVISVADGHGAPRYTRADRGSRLATQAALEVLAAHHDDIAALPRALVGRWRELVAADVVGDPPPRGEVGHRPPFELYGTTVLAAADLGDRLLFLQLGDGDTVLATAGGEVRRPMPRVEYAFPGATDSLVQADAAAAVRTAVVERDAFAPDVVLLATDGLDAAHVGRDWHGDVLPNWCQQLAGRDAATVRAAVEGWCEEAAAAGGDDTTVALLVNRRILGAAPS